nr:MAG TPA: hypothetical protein [Caudoviricetes sp.]
MLFPYSFLIYSIHICNKNREGLYENNKNI